MAKRTRKPSFKTITLDSIGCYLSHVRDKTLKDELRARGYLFTTKAKSYKARQEKIKTTNTAKKQKFTDEEIRKAPGVIVNPILWREIAKAIAKDDATLALKYMESVRPGFIEIEMLLKLHRLYQNNRYSRSETKSQN